MVLMHRGEEEGGEEEEEEEEEEEVEMESIERSYLELLGAGGGEGGDFVMVSKEEEVVVEEGFLFSPPYSSSSSNYSSSTCCFPHMLNFGGSDHDHGFLMPSDQHSLSPPPPPPPPVTSSKSKAKSSRRVSASRRATTTTTTEDFSTKNATNKKPKAQGTTKVRKEKIGDRINALQQLVSPFGKTDTATVLHEALGYIRFLHDQVQVLSSPYMQSTSPASSDHHEEIEEKMKLGRMSKSHKKDLRSRGLCLVPVSCTETVADKNGADMWSPAPCSSGPKH